MAELAEEEPDAADMVAARLDDRGEAVEPLPWCRWVWRAWHDLSDDRQWRGGGMGSPSPCNIPWTAARAYAADHGFHLPTLFRRLRAMDGVYAEWWAEQAKEAAKKKPEE
ncbi:hypothetical protein J2847_002966 [Azospirillum agricola]|uniref:hypothetical protein n=1 Tax=Azospirillum agricola TaxID=1720247 RepID=UPI001F39B62D|nr:hypothetical protein [Azospirillum agricola]MBP2229667.1 hypothetical protein [Azospirillum agricola]